MPPKVTIVAVLAILGFSIGVPVEESVPHNPQDDYAPSYTLHDSDAPENPSNMDQVPYNPQDFYAPSYTLYDSDIAEKPAANLEKLPYNPQDFYSPPLILNSPDSESSGRILGGKDADEDAAPYMVGLFVGGIIRSFLCGGTIITKKRVVTAAHCIDPMTSWWDGKLLDTAHGQVGSNLISKGYSIVWFESHENHPNWDRWTIKNDIGMLRLAEPFKWSKRVQPLKISFEWVSGGQQARANGWGRMTDDVIVVNPDQTENAELMPDRLQELIVDVLTPKECEEGVREANELYGLFSPPVDSMIEVCTLDKRGAGHGMCHGDSGSALVLVRHRHRGVAAKRQIGIVSWGFPCARGAPDMFVRLSAFRNWVSAAVA